MVPLHIILIKFLSHHLVVLITFEIPKLPSEDLMLKLRLKDDKEKKSMERGKLIKKKRKPGYITISQYTNSEVQFQLFLFYKNKCPSFGNPHAHKNPN